MVPEENDFAVFDRATVRRHRDRAVATLPAHDFLFREVADRVADRLLDFTRPFPRALDLGCHGGQFASLAAGRGGIESLVQCDLSAGLVAQAGGLRLVADEEALPFAPGCFDLVLSVLSLHWVNDLPGALVQVRRCLRPDGLLLAAMLGGETLRELREAMMAAELELCGGISPRVSPFAELRDAGGLLQRAGLALPVADADRITLSFEHPFALLRELRGLGETNAVARRRRAPAPRALFQRMAEIYHERFAGADGRIPATFDVLYLAGWAPHEGQQQPLKPGSATARLANALGSEERPAGEKAGPD